MRKILAVLLAAALLSLALGILAGPGGLPVLLLGARAAVGRPGDTPSNPGEAIKPPDFTVTDKPDVDIGPIDIGGIYNYQPPLSTSSDPPVTDPPTAPPVTSIPVTNPPVTNPPVTNPPVTNPPVTSPPSNENHQATDPPANENQQINDPPANSPPDGRKTAYGHFMTSEGPLFLSFRQELTSRLYMFTPMDLSLDGEYHIPLIGDTSQVVGEAKVVVQNGMTTVTYLLVNGVKLKARDEFFTFFRDIDSPKSLKTSKLQSVKLKFGQPYSVAKWLKSDPNVLLYINCPVSYRSDLPGLTPFSLQDPGYLSRMMALLPLMD